jgi:outer membrane protein assembly factor BamB
MSHKHLPAVSLIWRIFSLGCVFVLAAQPATLADTAGAALEKASVKKGICAVIGLPEAGGPEFVTGLAKENDLLIYFQAADCDEATNVRQAAETANLLGKRIFVDCGERKSIHLADNLADVVLVAPSAANAVVKEEVLRALHPGGKAFLGSEEIIKPFPSGTDDWSYPYHGPDNNPQSADELARAPYLTQFIAEPKFAPSPAVTVAAGGRVFRACGHLAHRSNQNALLNTLLAVNAYNGEILWKRPLSEGFMVLRNTIIATPDTLYLADDTSCKLLDSATGELKCEIVSPNPKEDGQVWKWMALHGDFLYGLIGDEEFKAPVLRSDTFGVGGWPRANWPGFDYQDAKTAWGQGRTLMAFNTKTKKVVWKRREEGYVDGRAVCMKNGRICFLSPEKSLGCLDGRTGDVIWRNTNPELLGAIGPRFSEQPRWTGLSPMIYARCNDEYLFFSGPRMPRVVAVSAENGRLAWVKEVPMNDGGSVHLLLREDALYAIGMGSGQSSFSMEYDTGSVLTHFMGRRACTAVTGSADSMFYRATGGTVRIDLAKAAAKHIAPMRPPCYEGVIISDGLLYWGPWKCRCQLSLYGNICLAPAGDFHALPGADDSRLAPGHGDPATVETFDSQPGDWPTYQADNFRTSTTDVTVPAKISRHWTVEPESGGRLTAPIVVGGVVFVGDDNGVVRALDSADGELKWKRYAGGAVFFPPAFWQGRVYVGSADGHVYAFEATTGRPLWKFLAAPAHRWIPVYGKLCSTWPVAGGVVVDKGTVYAAAGIAHYDGTHVYALDAITGQIKWHNGSSGTLSATTNSGVSLQGSLFLRGDRLCFAGGNACALATYDVKTGECTSPANERVASSFRTVFSAYYPEFSQYTPLNHSLPSGRLLNYSVDYSGTVHSTLALFEPLPDDVAKLGPNWRIMPQRGGKRIQVPTVWEHPPRAKYNSFVISPRVLLAAGQSRTEGQGGSFLSALSVEDGKEIWRKDLPAPSVKGGTAIDHNGRIIVSLQDGRVLCFVEGDR